MIMTIYTSFKTSGGGGREGGINVFQSSFIQTMGRTKSGMNRELKSGAGKLLGESHYKNSDKPD